MAAASVHSAQFKIGSSCSNFAKAKVTLGRHALTSFGQGSSSTSAERLIAVGFPAAAKTGLQR